MTAATMRDIAAADAHALVAKGEAVLVDVREAAEFAAERIAGAANHPLSGFNPAALPGKAEAVILHCGIGKRSAMAMEACRKAGVTVAGHMAGGLAAWKAAGLPTLR